MERSLGENKIEYRSGLVWEGQWINDQMHAGTSCKIIFNLNLVPLHY